MLKVCSVNLLGSMTVLCDTNSIQSLASLQGFFVVVVVIARMAPTYKHTVCKTINHTYNNYNNGTRLHWFVTSPQIRPISSPHFFSPLKFKTHFRAAWWLSG